MARNFATIRSLQDKVRSNRHAEEGLRRSVRISGGRAILEDSPEEYARQESKPCTL